MSPALHVARCTPHCMQAVLKQVVFEQYLDCFTVQEVRAVSVEFCCVRVQRAFLTYHALLEGLEPSAVLCLTPQAREERFPLPAQVLRFNTPFCPGHEDPHNFWPARIHPCTCLVIRRRQVRLEELFWRRQLRGSVRFRGFLRQESDSSVSS